MKRIKIFDTTLRDGEQSPGCSMNIHEKLEMARQLEKLGVDEDTPIEQKMLTNARDYGGASSCGFGAKLTVTFDDGRTVSVLKGTDSCASFTFGSWNTAMVSDSENRQFWQMFGVPFDE